VEGRAQRFPEEFEAVEHPDGSPHMRRIGSLLAVRSEDAKRLTVTQQFLQQQFFGLSRQEAVTKRAVVSLNCRDGQIGNDRYNTWYLSTQTALLWYMLAQRTTKRAIQTAFSWSSLTVQLDSQGTFVPCEARIVWYSAGRISSRQLRD